MLYEALRLAQRSIRRNMLRSSLTVLGIVIGVGAVIAMVTIGNGTTARVASEIAKLGSNLLVIRPGQFGPGRASVDAKPFTERDVETIRAQLVGVKAVAPVSQGSATVVFGTQNRNTQVVGTDNSYFITQDWPLAFGRQFLDAELRSGAAACVLGETLREKLFGGASPLGATVRIKRIACEVIGVLARKGGTDFAADRDDTVLLPLRAYHRRIAGNMKVSSINLSVADGVNTAMVQDAVAQLLRERRKIEPGEEDDFSILDMKQIVQTMTGTTAVLTGLLAAVASVSLLVGGIGIMNIMLVSVTERTREIGIRLAIGALEGQILAQFLVEAVVLSIFGGLLGVIFGLGVAHIATNLLQVPFVFDPVVAAGAFAFSALVGIMFGFFPARRAARLDPIVALRHE